MLKTVGAVCLLGVTLVLSESPVTLTSSLAQGSLCPTHTTVTFTCIAIGTEITWILNSHPYSFIRNSNVGEWDRRHGYFVILTDKVNASSPGEVVFTSVLTVSLSSREGFNISCQNQQSNTKIFEVYHLNSEQPLAPVNVSSTARKVEIESLISFSISWYQNTNSSIDHFVVQVDSHPPWNVSANSTTGSAEYKTVYKTMESSMFRGNISLTTVRVSAVDACGQASSVSVSTIERLESISTASVPQPTMMEYLTDQPATQDAIQLEVKAILGIVIAVIAVPIVAFFCGVLVGQLLMRRKIKFYPDSTASTTVSTKLSEHLELSEKGMNSPPVAPSQQQRSETPVRESNKGSRQQLSKNFESLHSSQISPPLAFSTPFQTSLNSINTQSV